MKLKITVQGDVYEVEVEVMDEGEEFPAQTSSPLPVQDDTKNPQPLPEKPPPSPGKAAGGAVVSPLAGIVVDIKCKPGEEVKKGQNLLVIEAMKMNTFIAAPAAGKVSSIPVSVGDSVLEGAILAELE